MNESDTALWMSRLAAPGRSDGALPDPILIWWQAQLLERQAARARAVRPTAIIQWLSLVVGVVVAITLCVVYWTGLRGLIDSSGALICVGAISSVVATGVVMRLVFGN